MPDAAAIGSTLRELRGNLPRLTVARACGISVSALTMYETGQRVPRDEIKGKLARCYGKAVETIFFKQDSHEM